jgi:hypothetical protein
MEGDRVHTQLDWILSGAALADAERASRLLRFVVERALEGRTGEGVCYRRRRLRPEPVVMLLTGPKIEFLIAYARQIGRFHVSLSRDSRISLMEIPPPQLVDHRIHNELQKKRSENASQHRRGDSLHHV